MVILCALGFFIMHATFIVLLLTILAFLSNRIRPDFVALCSALALFFVGVLDTNETFAGFSDPTVVMIAGLLVVSNGLSQSGVTNWLCQHLLSFAGDSEKRVILILMIGAAVLSGFISNTGIVAMLLPATIMIGRKLKISPGKLLIPLAFASNTGGLLTMIGTPPNVIVANVLEQQNLEPFNFFEFAIIGIPLLIVLIVYMMTLGTRFLPSHKDDPDSKQPELKDLGETYNLKNALFQIKLQKESVCSGKTLKELELASKYRINVLFVERQGGETVTIPGPETVLRYGDTILAHGSEQSLKEQMDVLGLSFKLPDRNSSFSKKVASAQVDFLEVMIPPRSSLIGGIIGEGSQESRKFFQVVAVRRGADTLSDFITTPLASGDVLLVRADSNALAAAKENPKDYLLLSHIPAEQQELSQKGIIGLGILGIMVALMLFRVVPSAMAAMIAACLMIMTRCLSLSEAYQKMNWQSLVLIGSMIPMSIALKNTGGAEFIALQLVETLGQLDPIWILGGIFLITSAFSQVMSNTATTILIAPIVFQTASELNVSPYPFFIAVAVAASTAFLTPIGTTTTVMVMTPGRYTFADYIKCGAPLIFLFLIASLILIPIFWPLSV